MSEAHAMEEAHHPGPGTYAVVAVILTVVTLIEFGAFYWEAVQPILVPMLLVLSAVKFALVVMFYMHLKFDSAVYTRLLASGIVVGAGVLLALMGLFFYAHPPGI